MTNSKAVVPATTAASKKISKSKSTVIGIKKVSPSHPPTSVMVNAAIKTLKERGGSSLQAIKKYISSTYKIDADKLAPFIKKYLKSATDKGILIRTKGKGAAGSFKLASKVSSKKVVTPKKKSVKIVKLKKEKSITKKAISSTLKKAVSKSNAEKKSLKKTKVPKSPKSKNTPKKSILKKTTTKK